MKKAFLVSFEFEYACLAEDEVEAKDYLRKALEDASFLENSCTVSNLTRLPDGWTKDCFVYHDGNNDITVEEALGENK